MRLSLYFFSRHVAVCLDPYCGLGFALWVLSSVYSGHHTILIPPSEVEANPAVWLTAVSQYKVRDTFCSYGKSNIRKLNRSSNMASAYRADRPAIRRAEASVFPSFFSQLKSWFFFGLNFPSLGLRNITTYQSENLKKCFSKIGGKF